MNRIIITLLVIAHLASTLWHGDAHTRLSIDLPPIKTLFVLVVILAAPLIGGVLLWTRYSAVGLWIVALSMFGAFLFGLYHHYIAISPDNVAHLPGAHPEFHSQFKTSAAAIAVLELVSAAYCCFCLFNRRRTVHVG